MAVKNFSFRIDEEMLHKLHVIADYEGRSANSQLNILVRDAVKKFESEHGKIELEKEQNK
ncbi:MAG: Arc family DNA-binding protein [Ruminococcaceae bacterium]|nr:Arc family DNA-binding protein [Oscillospiraceae bacterium]